MSEIDRPENIPLSTAQLIADLKAGRIGSNGNFSIEILDAAAISMAYASASFPIAVLIKALEIRDQEINNLKLRTGVTELQIQKIALALGIESWTSTEGILSEIGKIRTNSDEISRIAVETLREQLAKGEEN
jgi:hypothetical protein